MSTVNAIINENTITAQTIQRLIKANVGSAEVSAEVTMTNAAVTSYTGGQITENGEVKASFNQYTAARCRSARMWSTSRRRRRSSLRSCRRWTPSP